MVGNLNIEQRNSVLTSMSKWVENARKDLLRANHQDLEKFTGSDPAMYDRLKVDDAKIDGMIASLNQLAAQEDPVGKELFHFNHENGLEIYNKTASFGTVMIIYESRPDVTVEAAGIAFKSGNRILLKGGKESLNSNLAIVDLWHKALEENGIDKNWVSYLNLNREKTQNFLKNPNEKIDLIIPRGGEQLIRFVKENASCPVIVSGRGNNFVYVDRTADLKLAKEIIVNAKVAKISACNALDKVLIDDKLEGKNEFIRALVHELKKHKVQIFGTSDLLGFEGIEPIKNEQIWAEEFLDYKIVLGCTNGLEAAISFINKYGGGHSSCIITENQEFAKKFMEDVDSAAVYQNASTRFTDGFQFGLGGELAISTDKLHQRGPIGLEHLVTNKWYVYGNGQIR